jgi:hypothetical protein
MAGCGALSAVSGILDSNHGRQRRNGPRRPDQARRRPIPAARWPRRADTDHTARPPSRNHPGRGVRHRSTGPAAGHHGGRVRASAAIADGRCAVRIRTPDGDAAGVSDTRCPQRGRRTGRCPPAQRPADVTVEAAAEGPQRFRPGGGNGTGCRTPDPHTSRSDPAWTPRPPAGRRGRTQDRTPEVADGQSADRSLVTTSSTPPQGRPCGGRHRPPEPRAARSLMGREAVSVPNRIMAASTGLWSVVGRVVGA